MILIGQENLLFNLTKESFYEITHLIVHPEYKSPLYYNDIALLKFSGNVTFAWHIRPACLWQNSMPNETDLQATGYGTTAFGEIFMFVNVVVVQRLYLALDNESIMRKYNHFLALIRR